MTRRLSSPLKKRVFWKSSGRFWGVKAAKTPVDMGFYVLGAALKFGIMSDVGIRQETASSVGRGIRSRAFGLARAFVAYSVIQMCGSSRSIGAQKNDLQLLRSRPDGLVRSAATAGSRSVERRVPDRSGVGGAAHRVRRLRLREA